MPNLSDFDPSEINAAKPQAAAPSSGLTLDQLDPNEVELIPGGELEAKYGGIGQQALGALETAASSATFGLSKGAERLLGVNPEDIRGREEALNPVLSFGANVAGLFAPTGAAGLLGKAGMGAAKVAGLGAASTLGTKLASGAVKGFVEGALFQGGNEVAKMLLSDPKQTVGSAAASVGLAGLIGAPFGAAGEGAKALWQAKFGPKVQSNLERAASELSGSADDATGALTESFDLTAPKPNIAEIQQSAKRLGVDLSAGTVSNNSVVQNMEANLARRPTISGAIADADYKKTFKRLEAVSKEVLSEATDKTQYEVGKELKQGVIDSLETRLKPIEESYSKLRPQLKRIEIGPEIKQAFSESVAAAPEISYSKPLQTEANQIVESLGRVKNLDQLKDFGTKINNDLTNALASVDNNRAGLLLKVKDSIKQLRDAAIRGAEFEGKASPDTILKLRAADADYAGYKALLKQLGVEGGLGKPGTARGLLEKFKSISNENFAKNRIFDPQDYDALKFFKQNFPEQFNLARQLKLSDIAEKSLSEAQGKGAQFEIGTFLRQVSDKKMGPEVRDLLFGADKVAKLNDIKTIFQAIPGNPNPSGTSYAQAFGKLFSPEGVMQNITDAAQFAFLKAQPHLLKAAALAGDEEAAHLGILQFARQADSGVDAGSLKQTVDFIGKVIRGEKDMSKAAKSLFEVQGAVLSSRLLPDEKKRERLDNMLAELQLNPNPIVKVGDQVGAYMPDQAGALAEVSMNAVNYLNALRPESPKQNPLDDDMEPNAVEKATYARALEIAEQPLVVMESIKDGELTDADVTHLKNIYPGLYDRMSQKIMGSMVDHLSKKEKIPYKTRLGLSVFLGQPLDYTMQPKSILAAQPKPMQQQEQAAAKQTTRRGSMKDIGKLAQQNQTPQQARITNRNGF